MKNIEYLESFFRKHNLSGKIRVRYSFPITEDEYMSDIVFENGDVININDIRFDIDSELSTDMFDDWMAEKRKTDIGLIDWMKINPTHFPKNIDTSSIEEYKQELTELIDNVNKNIKTIFELEPDDGDSEENDGSEDE